MSLWRREWAAGAGGRTGQAEKGLLLFAVGRSNNESVLVQVYEIMNIAVSSLELFVANAALNIAVHCLRTFDNWKLDGN